MGRIAIFSEKILSIIEVSYLYKWRSKSSLYCKRIIILLILFVHRFNYFKECNTTLMYIGGLGSGDKW